MVDSFQQQGGGNAVGLIPARGGSKGVPRKNVTLVAGKPLLVWTAEAARQSRLQGAILSTDDDEIAEIGRACGLEVPFSRPAALANDSAKSIDVLLHAIDWLATVGRRPDVVMLLQPTAPLRTAADIDAVLSLLDDSDVDSVVSIAEVPSHFSPDWQLSLSDMGQLALLNGAPLSEIVPRRQLLRKSYYRNGAIYAIRREALVSSGSLFGQRCRGYVMPAERSVNIDMPEDFAEAERLLLRRAT